MSRSSTGVAGVAGLGRATLGAAGFGNVSGTFGVRAASSTRGIVDLVGTSSALRLATRASRAYESPGFAKVAGTTRLLERLTAGVTFDDRFAKAGLSAANVLKGNSGVRAGGAVTALDGLRSRAFVGGNIGLIGELAATKVLASKALATPSLVSLTKTANVAGFTNSAGLRFGTSGSVAKLGLAARGSVADSIARSVTSDFLRLGGAHTEVTAVLARQRALVDTSRLRVIATQAQAFGGVQSPMTDLFRDTLARIPATEGPPLDRGVLVDDQATVTDWVRGLVEYLIDAAGLTERDLQEDVVVATVYSMAALLMLAFLLHHPTVALIFGLVGGPAAHPTGVVVSKMTRKVYRHLNATPGQVREGDADV